MLLRLLLQLLLLHSLQSFQLMQPLAQRIGWGLLRLLSLLLQRRLLLVQLV